MTRINPRYARISQSVLDWHNGKPMKLSDVLITAEDVGKFGQQHVLLTDESEGAPKLVWGTALYEVQADGVLSLIKHNLDTSD